MSSVQPLVLSVPKQVALNPVARAVERAKLKRWFVDTGLQVQTMSHGVDASSLLIGLAEAFGIALKATEGFDDPEDVRGSLLSAMGHLVTMTNAGRVWDAQHAPEICDALEIAVDLLACSDPRDKLKAWQWVMRTAANGMTA